jgi:hypothetical protein
MSLPTIKEKAMGSDNQRQFGGPRPTRALSLSSQHPAVRPLREAAHQAAGAHCFLRLPDFLFSRLRRSRSAPVLGEDNMKAK